MDWTLWAPQCQVAQIWSWQSIYFIGIISIWWVELELIVILGLFMTIQLHTPKLIGVASYSWANHAHEMLLDLRNMWDILHHVITFCALFRYILFANFPVLFQKDIFWCQTFLVSTQWVQYGVLTVHSTLHSMGHIFWCANQTTTRPRSGQDQGLVIIW